MNSKPTQSEIATDRNLWEQYVDPQNNDPEAFERMTVEEKIALQRDLWPQEAVMTADEAIRILADQPSRKAESYAAVLTLSAAVLEESETGDPNDSLTDWIGGGTYTGSETVDSIAAEWDDDE